MAMHKLNWKGLWMKIRCFCRGRFFNVKTKALRKMSSFVFHSVATNEIIRLSKFKINLEIIGSFVIVKLLQNLQKYLQN